MAGLITVDSGSNSLQNEENESLLGVYLESGNHQELDAALISRLEELGIRIVEVSDFLPDHSLNAIRESNLFLFVRQNRPFVTPHFLAKNDSLYLQEDQTLIQFYRQELGNRATAFGLFKYPDDRSAISVSLLENYYDMVSDTSDNSPSLYYTTAFKESEQYPGSFSFRSIYDTGRDRHPATAEVIHFSPADNSLETIKDLKFILERQADRVQSLVLIPLNWLLEQTEAYEPLKNALHTYSVDSRVILPEPATVPESIAPNWIVILFVLLAGSYLLLFRNSAMYQRSVFRYFTMFNFFTEDLLENRLRPFIPGLILFFQHSVLSGITAYIVYNSFFTGLGEQALQTYFPVLFLFGTGGSSFFMFGVVFALILQFLSIIWLHFTNKRTNFKQILALYSWPLQLNLPVVLILLTIYLSEGSSFWIATFSILFVLIWFIAFKLSAISITRYLRKYRVLYILVTLGLHTILITGFFILLFIYPPVTEPIRLALALP